MIGEYCGDSIPPSHVSSSNEVLTQFHSDQYTVGAGFKMEYNPTGNTEYYGNYYTGFQDYSSFLDFFSYRINQNSHQVTHQFKTTLNIMGMIRVLLISRWIFDTEY